MSCIIFRILNRFWTTRSGKVKFSKNKNDLSNTSSCLLLQSCYFGMKYSLHVNPGSYTSTYILICSAIELLKRFSFFLTFFILYFHPFSLWRSWQGFFFQGTLIFSGWFLLEGLYVIFNILFVKRHAVETFPLAVEACRRTFEHCFSTSTFATTTILSAAAEYCF